MARWSMLLRILISIAVKGKWLVLMNTNMNMATYEDMMNEKVTGKNVKTSNSCQYILP